MDKRCRVCSNASALWQEADGWDQQQVPGAAEHPDWPDDAGSHPAGAHQVWDSHHHPCPSERYLWYPSESLFLTRLNFTFFHICFCNLSPRSGKGNGDESYNITLWTTREILVFVCKGE